MTTARLLTALPGVVIAGVLLALPAAAYPPAVGILSKSRDCAACHTSNGPWGDEGRTIIDLLDAKTKRSLRQADGTFRVEVKRNDSRTVITVIGRRQGEPKVPRRNAWLYVDPGQIESSSLSKFAPGWDANLTASCRIVGDTVAGYERDHVTALPLTLRPSDSARDGFVELQVMITAGESVKGKGREGLVSNYYVRKVQLKVVER